MKCACPAYFSLFLFVTACRCSCFTMCVLYVQDQYAGVAFVYLILNHVYVVWLHFHCHLFIQFYTDYSSIRFIEIFSHLSLITNGLQLCLSIQSNMSSNIKICALNITFHVYVEIILDTFSIRIHNSSVVFVFVHHANHFLAWRL